MPTRATNCVVAYLDILGYVKSVDAAIEEHRANAFLQGLREAFDPALEALAKFAPDVRHKPRIKAFSDNIVLALQIGGDAEAELLQMLRTTAYFQGQFAIRGFFIRGAVSIGLNYLDKEIVFGEALLEAYREETGASVNPRIVLAQSAVSNLNQHYANYAFGASPQGKVLQIDVDGKYFVDYLTSFVDATDGTPSLADMEKHKERVVRELRANSQDAHVWTKYVWVARYHNACCDRWSLPCKVDDAVINAVPRLFHGG